MRISDWSSDVCSSDLLAERERSVGDLERLIGLSQSALSQHLARLRRDGIVTTRRNAQTIYYALDGRSALRTEERCEGKECDSTWITRRAQDHLQKNIALIHKQLTIIDNTV